MGWLAGRGDTERTVPDRVLIPRLLQYVTPLKYPLIVTFLFTLSSTIFDLSLPIIMKIAVDDLILAPNVIITQKFNGVLILGLIYALFAFLRFLSEFIRIYLGTTIGQKIVLIIRRDMFNHLQEVSMDYFDREKSGVIVSRTTNDVERLSELLSSGLVDVGISALTLIGIVIALFLMSPILTVLTVLTGPIALFAIIIFRFVSRPLYQKTRKTIAKIMASFAENISGITVTKAFVAEEKNISEFSGLNYDNFVAQMKARTVFSILFPFLDLLSVIGVVLILGVGGAGTFLGFASIGTVAAFISYLNRFFRPILWITVFYNEVQSGLAAAERIFGLLDEKSSVPDPDNPVEIPEYGGIQFSNVSFSYLPETEVIHDFNLSVKPGETIALVGHTGAGKTTIIRLLARMYPTSDGAISFGEVPLKDMIGRNLRKNFGVIPQDAFLFDMSIAENIAYGKPSASMEEIQRAAIAVGAHDFITQLPDGYLTRVGERGGLLSQGERQLICFARAILTDPPILILDEATSSVDAATELIIQKSLEQMLATRTAFVIAHRLSTVRMCDRIIVMDKGRIVEEGSFDELLEAGGTFADLYQKQFVSS